jgi:hypothetical protein
MDRLRKLSAGERETPAPSIRRLFWRTRPSPPHEKGHNAGDHGNSLPPYDRVLTIRVDSLSRFCRETAA